MSTSAIHAGGLPPKTRQRIEARLQVLLTEHDTKLKQAGWFARSRLIARLEAQAFREVTGCEKSRWDWRGFDWPVVH